jgi:trehalose synthase
MDTQLPGTVMSTHKLDDYRSIVGDATIDELRQIARRLRGRRLKMINSTAMGGGVAEILHRLVPLLNELGIRTSWQIIDGGEEFFAATKKIHHALHGNGHEPLTARDFEVFLETNRANAPKLIGDEDFVVVHDPQPLALVEARRHSKATYWIWRCHIDLSCPDPAAWNFLRPFAQQFDTAVFSSPQFCDHLSIPEYVFYPPIDPLADKNRELPPQLIEATFASLGVPRDKPVVTQVSRFDPLKDPVGVIRAFQSARRYVDCRLVLAGGGANDDPERPHVLSEVLHAAGSDPDIHILADGQYADVQINALVRGSTIVMQKSLKEGFGLTVAEALWKRKPVIAGQAGGIPLQVIQNVTGVLVSSVEEAAYEIRTLLNDPERMRRLGEAGRKRVTSEFLIIGNLRRWLALMEAAAAGRAAIGSRAAPAAVALAP